jgi:hypothetical protein
MRETGVLEAKTRIELIEGAPFDLPPIGRPHSTASSVSSGASPGRSLITTIVSAQDPVTLVP